MKRRLLLASGLALAAIPSLAADKPLRPALQISDDTPEKMNAVLNGAGNVACSCGEKGEKIERLVLPGVVVADRAQRAGLDGAAARAEALSGERK